MRYGAKKFNIRYNANFTSITKDSDTRVWFAMPTNSEYQRINKIKISPKPHSIYNDNQGNKILFFEFNGNKYFNLQVDMDITLSRRKIVLKKKDNLVPASISKYLKKFIKREKFLEQTTQIKKTTFNITKDKKNDLEKIIGIFEFVVKNFKYCYPVKKRGVKYLNFKNLKGDCGEYASVFVTMCRILKIPARNNTGFVIFPRQKKVVEHGWASVYLKKYGWVDFDPQYASLEKNYQKSIEKFFGQRNDYRISFVNGFNIPIKPKILSGSNLDFWKKVYLPISNNSVQILQPVFFTSKEKIKFNEKIEILK